MHTRRFVSFLVGMWLGGIILMMWIGSQNQDSVTRILMAQPQKMQQIIFTLTDSEKKSLFLYAANEMTRYYSNIWEWAQLALGATILGLLVVARQAKQFIVISSIMLLTVIACHFLLAPQLLGLGRTIDFGAPTQFAAERSQFNSMQMLYFAMDITRLLLAILLTFQLLRRGSDEKRRRRSPKTDEIQYPNYGHVDG